MTPTRVHHRGAAAVLPEEFFTWLHQRAEAARTFHNTRDTSLQNGHSGHCPQERFLPRKIVGMGPMPSVNEQSDMRQVKLGLTDQEEET